VIDVSRLFEWLLDGAPGVTDPLEIADRIGAELEQAGIPIERMGVFVTTLHPNVAGRGFIWEKGKPTRMAPLAKSVHQSSVYTDSPIYVCTSTNAEWRWRTGEPDNDWGVIHDLRARGCVDYVCLPIRFIDGKVHVMSVASNVGFTEDHLDAIRRIIRPLARLTEIHAMRRLTRNILQTYVGPTAGERVLSGQIFKGDVETIRAAIWFSDLRGFTEMSTQKSAKEMIAILNDVFECQVPAIEKRGGEVLKFIGDGLLAIFPITESAPAKECCNAAYDAAKEAFAALAALNAKNGSTLRIGLALHVGNVEYGNIGGASRLDFTAIGPAVNMASRLEGLTSKLGRMVVSAEFAALSERTFEDLGTFELKGIAGPQRVFG
jgi:adenylate cyclase